MSLTRLLELRNERSAEITLDGNTYTRVWHGYSDNSQDTAADITNSSMLQWLRTSTFPGDEDAICESVTAVSLEDASGGVYEGLSGEEPERCAWKITARWATPRGSGGEGITIINPLIRPPDMTWSFDAVTFNPMKDALGNFIHNSAGDLLDPPPPTTEYAPVLEIVRNEPKNSQFVPRMQLYQGTMNDVGFWGVAPYQARLVMGPFERRTEKGVTFWRCTYRVYFRLPPLFPDGWLTTVLDCGWNQLDTSDPTGKSVIKIGPRKERPATPQPLDNVGHYIAPPNMNWHYLKVYTYHATDWTPLGLDYSAGGNIPGGNQGDG